MEEFLKDLAENGISPEEAKKIKNRTEKSMAVVEKIYLAKEQLKE
jgi:hypothetical protein